MIRTLILLTVLLSISQSIAAQQNNAGQIQAAPQPEDYAVWSALLEHQFAGARSLVINREVSGCTGIGNNREGEQARQKNLAKLPARLPGLSAETVADFRKKERTCHLLQESFRLPVRYFLLDKQERRSIFPGKNVDQAWRSFDQKFPGSSGIINVSSVGFNRNRTQALIDTSWKCGSACGGGKMVLLTKNNGQWKVTSTLKVWEISPPK